VANYDNRALKEAATPLRTVAGVHPAFASRLAEASLHINHEGGLPSLDGQAKAYEATKDAVALSVAIATGSGRHTVVTARHRGAGSPEQRAACECFCRVIEGLPIQEAAEHGAIRLIESLRDPEVPSPVSGILTPRNAGKIFLLLEQLIRSVYKAYLADSGAERGWNQWNPKIPAEWLRLNKEEQAAKLKPELNLSIIANGLNADDLWISDIEKGLRVILSFAPTIPSEQKPPILMRIERHLRDAIGIRLEVYVEEMGDQNKIRRL
jgi:hypothetical protein